MAAAIPLTAITRCSNAETSLPSLDALDIDRIDYVGFPSAHDRGGACDPSSFACVSLMLCENTARILDERGANLGPAVKGVRERARLNHPDATMERWLTPEFRGGHRARWQQIRDTVAATSVAGYAARSPRFPISISPRSCPALAFRWLVLYGEEDRATRMRKIRDWPRSFPAAASLRFRARGICE